MSDSKKKRYTIKLSYTMHIDTDHGPDGAIREVTYHLPSDNCRYLSMAIAGVRDVIEEAPVVPASSSVSAPATDVPIVPIPAAQPSPDWEEAPMPYVPPRADAL